MGSIIRKVRPSPAMVVSVIALVFAVGGVASGLQGKNSVDSGDLKKNVVKSKHIKDGGAKYKDLEKGIAVRAYALVTGDGEVAETYSRGISDSNINVFGGGFCIENLPFQPKHIQATHRYLSGGSNELTADLEEDPAWCQGNDAWVHIGNDTGPDFFVALYQ
jgi:hypothetical protein